jgi:LysM repeat protein
VASLSSRINVVNDTLDIFGGKASAINFKNNQTSEEDETFTLHYSVNAQESMHVVKKGETLYSIAHRYQVEVDTLKKWNNLQVDNIFTGQKLYIKNRPSSSNIGSRENIRLDQGFFYEDLDGLIEKLDSTAVAYSSMKYNFPSQDSYGNIESLFSISADSSQLFSGRLAELEAEENILRGDYGLDLQAGYLENFAAGFLGQEGIFYKRRAQFGIEWDLLSNGLVENRYKINELERQKNTLFSAAEIEVPGKYFGRLKNQIVYTFNRKKAEILESYLQLLSQQEEILVALYHQNYETWDDVLALTSEKARIDRLLRSTKKLNNELATDSLGAFDVESLPVLNLNLSKFIKAVQKQNISKSVPNSTAIADYHAINDISLSTSLDYNFFSNAPEESLTGVDGQREYVSAGVNLSIPFPLQIKENNDLVEAKRRALQEEALSQREDKSATIYKIYEEHQSLLAEYERDYKSYRMHNEEIRKLIVKKRLDDPEYSPQKLINVLDDRFKKMLELHNNHRSLYEKILEAYELTHPSSVRQYVAPVVFESVDALPDGQLKPKYERSIYIWSSTFEKYLNTNLIEYLDDQNFDTIFLSAGTTPDVPKVQSFIEEAHAWGIRVEMMVGDNNLLFESHQQEVGKKIMLASSIGADGLHLDVEPQTFDDWDEKKEQYLRLYLQMARKAFDEAQDHGLTLSLSVPVYYDSIIKELSRYADGIQLMAYGTDDAEKIKSRTTEERSAAPEKVAIALRPQDFENYAVFELFIGKMRNELTINRFSIHDLEALLKIQGKLMK